ncbi:Permease of the drug/metabolite transporter (DMT) superfamily [Tardiphaga sp. OK246]|nr:Permease of the drug/metabolite transporter (DMT) superfamily [Tardiphaga sp. OK246]
MTSHVPPPKTAAPVSAHRHTDRPLRGILMIICSTAFLASSDAMAKYLSRTGMPSVEIAWIRFLVFVAILLPIVLAPASGNPMRSTRPLLQVFRGLGLLCSSIFFIMALGYLPIAEATATGFISPLFVTGLSVLFLGEKVGLRRWTATIAGLLGVLIIVRPGTAAFQPGTIFPIISALGWATALVLTRKISGADRAITTMAFSAITGFLMLSVIVPFYWIVPSWTQIALGVGIGVAATVGHWIVVLAFRYADASVLAPFSYVQLVWVTLIGFFLFGEVPDAVTFAGAAIIIASGVYTAHRERVRRAQVTAPAEPYPSA